MPAMTLTNRFSQKSLAELANAQAVVIPYDGLNPRPAAICYLKPFYLDPNISYFDHIVGEAGGGEAFDLLRAQQSIRGHRSVTEMLND